ncbi:SDR family NAD(P)-dependent oxidoreductase [Pseudomonas schmalbachii]|uniref:SDR family NAD(P)-dependent oxidoreductase n=1 Tax=Pseudomonas schmalbachii TaxID=2816993 RepID=A0ABS3TXR0_9PSED|nr:SDR family NAD(P)-dependent oxidoreductase [Pseudomonas schmalbachii]MBO3277379.1 SDR family NAD(P)-dependent oxidoreductase [Pseudomonas schmalbachii]
MEKNLKGQVIAVTGAFGNLGLAVAQAAAERGAKVVMIGRSAGAELPPALSHALEITGVDLASFEDAQAAMARIRAECGRLDALVNVAGGFRWETLEDGDLASWDFLYNVNLRTAASASKAALPLLLKAPAGRIVNVGASGAQKAGKGMGAYAASKAGVARLTESLAEELKDRGITVNAVLPSIIDTPQNRADMPNTDYSRWVTPEKLAAVILFLLSTDASAVTGALIPVTGRV